MDYRNSSGNDMPEQRRRVPMDEIEQPQGNYDMMQDQKRHVGKMQKGKMKTRTEDGESGRIEELYSMVDKHMEEALCFHSQLADYFCFLGLQGFKRMAEYQFMKECAALRKLHRRYIDTHHRVLPVEDMEKPHLIPKDWMRYTTHDIDDSVISRFVKMALKEWYEWEKDTKDLYESVCDMLQEAGVHSDYDYVQELIVHAEKECKKIMRLMEKMQGTGYDVTVIHGMQDQYHDKYKKKYKDHFTVKNNYPSIGEQVPVYPVRRRRIGYL